jgi:hypothetical protein
MRRLLASPRFRRRAAWVGSVLILAGALAFVGVRFANTGQKYAAPFTEEPVQRPPRTPRSDPFTAAERKQVRAVAVRFIETAVYRKNVDDSWEITAPALHQGLSRAEWASGSIPVVPYPQEAIQVVRWRVNYSFVRTVGLKVAFYPKPTATVLRQVFDIELHNFGTDARPRWLVSGWTPSGGPTLAAAAPGIGPPVNDLGPLKSALRPIWLLLPVGLIAGSLLSLLLWLALRGWFRQARANRAYSRPR